MTDAAPAPTCDVVIPTWRAARWLPGQLAALARQSTRPRRIVVIDSSSPDDSVRIAREAGCTVEVIAQAEFNHGGTRNRAAELSGDSAVVVFLTQDALPDDDGFLGRLLAPFADPAVGAAYARQVPYPDAPPPEVFARGWNYPATSERRSAADLERLRGRAVFFSNVASAVRRTAFDAVGRFPDGLIMNEDVVLCARLLRAGWTVCYAADAAVRHSHDYTLAQQFRRYFDIGVFHAQHRDLLSGLAFAGEGARFALAQLGWLVRRVRIGWALRSPIENGLKFAGFHLGKRHRRLPRGLCRRLSMHRAHWAIPATRA